MAYTPTLWAKGDVVTSEKLNKIEQGIVDKVDKVDGKGLSTNDYTNQDKAKLDGLESQIDHLESLVGSPLVASTAAEMTNEDKIYVYTGNETGYQNGYWYYYDGTAWTQGGVYNSVAINVDDTLSISGVPADSKKTGDEIADLKSGIGDLTQLNTENKSNLVAAINEAAQTGSGGDVVRHLPSLKIYGDISVMTAEKNEPKIYQYIWEDPDNKEQRTGYCSMKWQGQSSTLYPKKNYTIKFFHDAKYKRKDKISLFDELVLKKNKWVVKANWVDRSMAKNIVSCRLWKQLVKSRDTEPEAHLKESPNYGAVNGYPIQIYVNDVWHGLYTFNIPKDEDLFGMDAENPLHCAICGETQSQDGATAFRVATTNGWELEVPDAWASYEVEEEGQTVTKYVADGLINLINFVMTATDTEFKENLNSYLDVESAIDYYLMAYLDCGVDSLGRNLILLTYDGGNKWYCSLYDADTTWGNGTGGQGTYNPTLPCPEGYEMYSSLLWQRMETCFGDELYARWHELRQNIFRADYIKNQFTYFWEDITEKQYADDIERWRGQDSQRPNVPQWNIDVQKAIFDFVDARLPYCDTQIKAMRTPVPCTGITLNESSIRFTNGSPVILTATLTPENTTDEVVWTSSDNTVVTVTNGTVYPLKNGTATITATCGNQTATCAVTVVGLSFEISLVGGHATLSNTDVIAPNASYTGTLTADTGFEFTSVVITMGGTDITATAYSNGTISIAQVTGDIVVTVETVYHYDETGLAYKLGSPFTADGTHYVDTGYKYDGLNSFTIAVDITQGDTSNDNWFMMGAATYDDLVLHAFRFKTNSYAFQRIVGDKSIACGASYTAGDRVKLVVRYDHDRQIMSGRGWSQNWYDTHPGQTGEVTKTTSVSKNITNNANRDKFSQSLYIGAVHLSTGPDYTQVGGTIHDMRIYNRRWTDAEVKQWLGVDSLSTVFTDDMDQ